MARQTRSASTPSAKPKAKKEESTPKPKTANKKATPKSSAKATPADKAKAESKSNLRAKASLSNEPPSPTQSSSDDGEDSEDAYGEESTAETEHDEDDESAFSGEEEEDDSAEDEGGVDSDNLDAESDVDETPKTGKRKSVGGSKGSDTKKVKYDPDGKNTRVVEQQEKVPGPTTNRQYHPTPPFAVERMYANP